MTRIVAYNPEKPWLGGNIIGGDENTWAPAVWDYIIERFKPENLIDVGCGEGHLISYFQSKNIVVLGIDGLAENKLRAPDAVRNKIVIHDFRERYQFTQSGENDLSNFLDMVISCEFVEHVDEEYAVNYLDVFQKGKIVVFTHAVPGQTGHNHVNCRDDSYWIDIMKILEYNFLQPETQAARDLACGNLWNTTLIFKRK
jgi:SAM-dependent methyltransferase